MTEHGEKEFSFVCGSKRNEVNCRRSVERVGLRECILIEVNVVDTACALRNEDKSHHGKSIVSNDCSYGS